MTEVGRGLPTPTSCQCRQPDEATGLIPASAGMTEGGGNDGGGQGVADADELTAPTT